MFIQGNLQAVFDALFTMGAIDPVLKMDWQQIHTQKRKNPGSYEKAVTAINGCQGHPASLLQTMRGLDGETVNFIAVEVARELAEYTDRKMLH